MYPQNTLKHKTHPALFLVAIWGVASSAVTLGSQALASDTSPKAFKPRVEGELSLEAQSDNIYKSDDQTAELSDNYISKELGLKLHLATYFQVVGTFLMEPVRDPMDDRFFEDLGAYTEEIYARFTLGQIGVNVGKYGPAFGRAWYTAPGLYGDAFAEDYELAERVGLAVTYDRSISLLGDIKLVASAFKLDDTALSRSIFTGRGKISRSDGGASNTGGLESFALDAQFSDIMNSGVGFNFGYRLQAKGSGPDDIDNEQGFVLGANGEHDFKNAKFEWLVEGARLNNFEASSSDVDIITAGMQVTFNERYNIAITGAHRNVNDIAREDYTDHMLQISAGMEVYRGWTANIGHKWEHTENSDSRMIGVLFAKTFEFNSADK